MFRKITFLIIAFLSLFYNGNAYKQATDSLLKELKKPHTDSIQVINLLNICEEGIISKDSAFDFIQQALMLSEHTKYPALISKSRHYLTHWHIGNTKNQDTILFYCRTHLERMQQLKFIPGIALAYGNLGMAYTWYSLDSSMYYNLKSVELYNKAEKFDNANIAKLNLANVYLEMKRYSEAISIFKETANYSSKTGNRNAAALSYFNMSECYTRLGKLTDAEKCINKGCTFNDSTPYSVAYCNAMLADVYLAQGRMTEAQIIYESILKTAKKNNLEYILYRGYKGMADVSFKKGLWGDAIQYKNMSWDYSYKDLDSKQSLYEMMYKCDSALGNYKSSLLGHQQYIAVRDSYENVERLKNADALEAKYKNKENLTKIELLDKEKEIQKASVEKQMLIRNSVIGIAAILAVITLLLFNRFKLKKKIESQQAIINERKRISNELHDDLGAQLSTARMFLNSMKNNADSDKNKTLVENSIQLIDGSISDLRKIMDDLQVSTLQEKGYIIATEELVNKINQLQQISFTLSHHGIDSRFDHKTEHNLFRVTQELINNTLKYAKAKNVSIDLLKRENKIVLMYEDDGEGFDLKKVKRGYGLSNIESRIKSLNGELNLDTAPGNGFRTTIEMPL